MLRGRSISLDHFVEFKGREVGVTFDITLHPSYPATEHDPGELAHCEVTGFEIEHGFDHVEEYVNDLLENEDFIDELTDLAYQKVRRWIR